MGDLQKELWETLWKVQDELLKVQDEHREIIRIMTMNKGGENSATLAKYKKRQATAWIALS